MKRIFKFFIIFVLTLGTLALSSCTDDPDTPDGMQLAGGGADKGYKFFVPEEWIVSSYGEIDCAYVSAINNTSVSFAEAAMPDYGLDGLDTDEVRLYFNEHMKNLDYMQTIKISPDANGAKCTFGNESNAYKFVYTYDYPWGSSAIHYKAMQILVVHSERLYIFQYNSQNSVPSYVTDGRTYYDVYLESVNKMVSSFKFTGTPTAAAKAPAGSAGELVLVSDRSLTGFDFYAPKDSQAVASSALVHRDLGGGASVSISELILDSIPNQTVFGINEYWLEMKKNFEKSFGEITLLSSYESTGKDANGKDQYPNLITNISGAGGGRFYEYEYTYADVTYRSYMVIIGISGTFSNEYYVYTYSAPVESYNKELCDKMLAKVTFI